MPELLQFPRHPLRPRTIRCGVGDEEVPPIWHQVPPLYVSMYLFTSCGRGAGLRAFERWKAACRGALRSRAGRFSRSDCLPSLARVHRSFTEQKGPPARSLPEGFPSILPGLTRLSLVAEQLTDPFVRRLPLAVENLRVDLEQHVHGVARSFGDLSGKHSSSEPRRDRRVPEVVRVTGQRRDLLKRRQPDLAGLAPSLSASETCDDSIRGRTRSSTACSGSWKSSGALSE